LIPKVHAQRIFQAREIKWYQTKRRGLLPISTLIAQVKLKNNHSAASFKQVTAWVKKSPPHQKFKIESANLMISNIQQQSLHSIKSYNLKAAKKKWT